MAGYVADWWASLTFGRDSTARALVKAAGNGRVRVVEMLLRRGAWINGVTDWEATPLMAAAQQGHLGVVQVLLDNGARVDARDRYGETALTKAAARGHSHVVRALRDKGAALNVESREAGRRQASQVKNSDAKATTVVHGRSSSQSNLDRWKSSGEPEVWVRAHLNGWNNDDWLELLASLRNSQYCPMDHDAIGQTIEALRTRLSLRASTARPLVPPGARHMATSPAPPPAAAAKPGATAANLERQEFQAREEIFEAVKDGRTDFVKSLISRNQQLARVALSTGHTLLHQVALYGRGDLVAILIQAGASLNQKESVAGETALHMAVRHNRADIVESLLRSGADVNARNMNLFTPLHDAAYDGNVSIIEILLGFHADINAKEQFGNTPTAVAFLNGQSATARFLLSLGGMTNIHGHDPTAFHPPRL